jgi:hypothetical protein
MEPHALTAHIKKLIEDRGVPQVLDVDHSVQVHKPILTGSDSPASYYIRPPSGMTVEEFIEWFESIPDSREFKLTLVPILGLDTYHQPLISADDFAKKYFHDNHARIVRVVGKSNSAIEAMNAFVDALKRPFDSSLFPHHADFSVSGYKTPEMGGATEVKLLFKPANHGQLMKVERLVSVHLDECNLGREIWATRHSTRSQAPELILTSTSNTATGNAFLEALANSLPRATPQEIAEATDVARVSHTPATTAPTTQARFEQVKVPTTVLPPNELKKKAIASLAEVLKVSRFANGADVNIVQAGTTIEITFPRSISTLWLSTTFRESLHIKEVANFCMGVRTDPVLRHGWSALYNYDSKTGKLHIKAMEAGSEPPVGWKLIPFG